jgi:lipopolysaccharide transport system ATP-binding protein
MSDPVIRVEGLGKKYVLAHRPEGRRGYSTLRDALAEGLRSAGRLVLGRDPARDDGPPAREEFWALRDVSFEVQRGEVIGIIGRNGAGKSTLLKILSRITEPTAGRIILDGRVGSLLEVGTGFHPELTGRENVYLNGAILGMSRAEICKRFDAIVAFAEVEQFLDMPVKRYSSGMYMRLAFAVAAHLEPEILIVDEVLAVGDAAFQRKCLGRMGELAHQGRTVLFVSHNIGVVRSLCQKAIWLKKGRVHKQGPAGPVTDHYLRSFASVQAQQLDLRRLPRRHGGSLFRLCDLVVNGGQPVQHGEPFQATLRFEALQDCHDVSLGMGFSTLEGVRLLSTDSDLTQPRQDLVRGTTGQVQLRMEPLLLQPGMYLLDLGARSGENFALDYISGALQLEILPGPRTPACLIRNEGTGGVRLPASWEWDMETGPVDDPDSEDEAVSVTAG